QLGHGLALQQPGNETQAFFHDRTLLPGHCHLPPGPPVVAGGKCYPCVRYVLSPMSRAAHKDSEISPTAIVRRLREFCGSLRDRAAENQLNVPHAALRARGSRQLRIEIAVGPP